MNFCNYAKIIIARNSKDPNSSSTNQNSGKQQLTKFSNTVPVAKRYEFYENVMQKYPKMYLSFQSFSTNLPRLQRYITNSKYWKNGNRNGEKSQFIQTYSLQSWSKLHEREKQMHTPLNCVKCEVKNPEIASTHSSVSESTENIIAKTNELATEIQKLNAARRSDGAEQLIKIIEPIMENTFQKSLKNTVTSAYNLTEKLPSDKKHQQKVKSTRENTQKISNLISNTENEIVSFLASGSSYNQRDRERMNTYFETTEAAHNRSASKVKKKTEIWGPKTKETCWQA
jgi:hypothetical protein